MAELTLFSYRSGHSLLHRSDVRFKILSLLFISMASLNVRVLSLTILSSLIIILVIDCRPAFNSFLREIRHFLFLMLIILVAHTLSTKGAMVFQFYFLSISIQGIYDGALICWRLLLIMLVGLLFVSTTKPSQIKAAVEWFLNPVPFVSGKRLATMLSLVIRFIPVIHCYAACSKMQIDLYLQWKQGVIMKTARIPIFVFARQIGWRFLGSLGYVLCF
jgi:energy-coupling factor transporter transmembrane protein EcfT